MVQVQACLAEDGRSAVAAEDGWSAVAGDERQPAPHIDALQHFVDLLRFSRLRLTALRLRVLGARSGFGELLVARALGRLGYAGVLRGGDVVFIHVADADMGEEEAHDRDIEQELMARLSSELAALGATARMAVLVSVAHVWSDEIGEAADLVALLTRLPRADITVPRCGAEPELENPWACRMHAGAI